MKRYRITLEGQTFDVEVLDDPRQEQVRVKVDRQVSSPWEWMPRLRLLRRPDL